MGFWHFVKATKLPTPGAMQYGLETNNQFANNTIGSAIGRARQFRVTFPTNYQGVSVASLTGLGGLAQGQIALQSLSDPYNYEAS